MHSEVEELLHRSHRLGADKRLTNYGGGNTSAKVMLDDPVTGEPTAVMVVKGSGGDLATLAPTGLAYLVLERVVALEQRYDGGVGDDDMVDLYEHCRFGSGGAVPSIDAPLHALIAAPHVDHLHPDAVIALATAEDGQALVEQCFGDDLGWIEWIRPGYRLALRLRALREEHPEARGAVLGGHGLVSWGDTSEECEATSRSLVARARAFLDERDDDSAFGPLVESSRPLDEHRRRMVASDLGPVVRGIASTERPVVAHFDDSPEVLEFLSRRAAPRLAAAGTSCPDHFLRTKIVPLMVDVSRAASIGEYTARLRELHGEYREEYAAYYGRHARAGTPPMRNPDPAIVLVPGVGMWSFGLDPIAARVTGEFYWSAIAVMRGAESVSRYSPIPEAERFGIEYWELEERKLRMRPAPRSLAGRVALVTGGGSGIGRAVAHALAEHGASVVVTDLDTERAGAVADEIGDERARSVGMDVSDESSVAEAFRSAALLFGGVDLAVNNAGFAAAAPLVETDIGDWDKLHAVLARGSFLVSRAAARQMIEAGTGGDIVYVVSKNAVAAGPSNVGYSAAKADQAHQVRLLAAELGRHGIRVNGVNPDGVVQGSGIFTGKWLEERAAVHGVEPDELADFYAGRTLLGRSVLPEHVGEAVTVLAGGHLSRTTGLLVPVDGGVAEAFLR